MVGARPQFIKAAALSRAIAGPFRDRIEHRLLHTGQHFDAEMSQVFFEELGIRWPDVRIASDPETASHIGRMMAGVELEIARDRPDVVLVYGDTNSTLAGALAACRTGVPLAHVEAGLRSFDNRMPEEENRVLADHASTWLFCPTKTAVSHLLAEGIQHTNEPPTMRFPSVTMVGDVMLDNARHFAAQTRSRPILERLGARVGAFALATVHRASTVVDGAALEGVFRAFRALHAATGLEVLVPLHPRTAKALGALPRFDQTGVRIVPPMGYLDMLALVHASRLVLTDSGGLQKEACFLGKHCLILRDRTEWVELLGKGGSVLVGTDPERIVAVAQEVLNQGGAPVVDEFGDGHAAEHICAELLKKA